MHRLLLALGLILALPAAAFGGLERTDFRLERLARGYLAYVPDRAAPAEGRPIVLVLHGGGGSAQRMLRLTGGGFHGLAEDTGAVIVYAEAFDGLWDFGEGTTSAALQPRRDDLAYFRAVIADVARRYGGDTARVYSTGISRGGQASYFLACRLPGGVRAIAPVAMPLPAFLHDDCRSAEPTGVMILNGVRDPIVPYDGGVITLGRRGRDRVLSSDETAAFFARRNGCRGAALAERIGQQAQRRSWQDCRLPTVLYRLEDGGHTWPSGPQYLPQRVVGPVSREIDATAEIAAFFRALF
jgi:polyhydroxybutyrate depolymerase